MGTVFRLNSLRVVIYSNDHWPPHVHVVGPDREAKILLGRDGEPPAVVWNEGLSRLELIVALFEVDERGDLLMQRWREIHGDA